MKCVKILFVFINIIMLFIIVNDIQSGPLPPVDENLYRFIKENEKRPAPVGGYESVSKKIIYPDIAIKTHTEGKIYLFVFLNESGVVDEVEVVKGIGAGCEEATADAIKKTKFVPSVDQGKAIKAKFPVILNLQLPK